MRNCHKQPKDKHEFFNGNQLQQFIVKTSINNYERKKYCDKHFFWGQLARQIKNILKLINVIRHHYYGNPTILFSQTK